MSEQSHAASLRERVEWRVAVALEPFLVIDVTPEGESYSTVFHILRDMVDEGRLAHGGQGYSRV